MLIKKYEFDWYDKFWINVINSKRAYEGYGGTRLYNKEYSFKTDLSNGSFECLRHIVEINLPYVLRVLEKIHLLNDGILPDILKFMVFDGTASEINIPGLAVNVTDEFNEDVLDAEIILMVDAAQDKDRSVIFQRRIPWELKRDDDGMYSVYGRFATGTI